jgi:hypothetical protein
VPQATVYYIVIWPENHKFGDEVSVSAEQLMVEALSALNTLALVFLIWFVWTHIANRVKRQAEQYGELDAKIDRLGGHHED